MSLDPRIEAALVEFARTRLVPPGYTIKDVRSAQHDVLVHQPWVVTRGDWSESAKTVEQAVVAAWAHSDHFDVPPPGYEISIVLEGWRVFTTDLPHWSFEDATREGAIAKAWDHHAHAPTREWAQATGTGRSCSSQSQVESMRTTRYLGGNGSGKQAEPPDYVLGREPSIVINDIRLSEGQAMTLRVALSAFNPFSPGLGDDTHGREMSRLYLARRDEVLRIMLGK